MSRRRATLAVANQEPAPPLLRGTVMLLNAIMKPFVRPSWSGTEKLPKVGGLVIAVNHISNTDPLAIGQFLAYSGRWPYFLAKSSLFGVPGFRLTAAGYPAAAGAAGQPRGGPRPDGGGEPRCGRAGR